MALTRSELTELDEAQLRTRVLIPLFKAMGFHDIEHYHGGSQEHGKDITMWRPEWLRERVNYGVVVKAKRVSGKASGTSSAGEVRIQIEQCFDKPYSDPITTQEQHVDRCWVVTSDMISKEARNALDGILTRNRLDKITDFIDGDKLWELVEHYLPSWAVIEKVQQAQAVFEEVSPNYRITVATKGGTPVLSFEEKHPGAVEAEPLEIALRCQFPPTAEGEKVREAVEQHIKRGDPISLEGIYIEELKLPPFLDAFLDPEQRATGILTIRPERSPQPLLVKIEVTNEDGGSAILEYIALHLVQAGREEATFDNAEQPIPWKIQVTYKVKDSRLGFQYQMNFSEVNVRQVLRGLRFHEAIAKGGILKISDLETGFRIYEAEVPNGVFQGPEAVLMRLVENLVFIQDKVYLPLRMPGPRFTREDFEGVAMLVQKLKTGEIPLSDIGVDLDKESAIRMIEIFRDGSPLQADDAEEIVEICGATIPLGSMRVSCERACIPQADVDQLNATVASAQTGEMIHIRLTACEGYSMVAKYEKWLREN